MAAPVLATHCLAWAVVVLASSAAVHPLDCSSCVRLEFAAANCAAAVGHPVVGDLCPILRPYSDCRRVAFAERDVDSPVDCGINKMFLILY